MSAPAIVAVLVAVALAAVAVVAVVAGATAAARRSRLRERFGAEYDRAVAESGSPLRAAAELAGRQRRVRDLDVRPLTERQRVRYAGQRGAIQQSFVDDPLGAVSSAQRLVAAVMSDRGYPTQSVAQMMADLSVEHAATVGSFRAAQDIAERAHAGEVSTEDLRQALIHCRTLITDLISDPGHPARDTASRQPAAPPADTDQDSRPLTGRVVLTPSATKPS